MQPVENLITNDKENDILHNIDGDMFFKVMEEFSVDITHFYLDKRNLNAIEVNKLNKALLSCKQIYNIPIIDCLSILERDYFAVSKIMLLLSDGVKKTLRRELKDYSRSLKIPHNSLSTFFATK